MYEGVWRPGGFRPLAHVHRAESESFRILEGTFEFRFDGRSLEATLGMFLRVPPGVVHGFPATSQGMTTAPDANPST